MLIRCILKSNDSCRFMYAPGMRKHSISIRITETQTNNVWTCKLPSPVGISSSMYVVDSTRGGAVDVTTAVGGGAECVTAAGLYMG